MRKRLHKYKKRYVVAQRAHSRRLKKVHLKHARRFSKLRKHPFYYPALLFMILMGLFIGFMVSARGKNYFPTDSKIVIISHDGLKETIPTKAPTVSVFLTKEQIKLNVGDVVEPGLDTKITQDDFRINIYRSQPVEIVDGSHREFTFSAETTPRSIVQQSGTPIYAEDGLDIVPTTNFLTNGAIGEQIVIARAAPINVNLYGTATVIRTHAKTVGDLLKEKHIVLAKDDHVEPSVSTPLSPAITVYLFHKGTKVITVQEQIAMPMQTILDNNLAYGTSAVRQAGSPGTQISTYQIDLKNNVEVGRTLLNTVITQQPVTEILAQGTNLSGIKGDMALAGIGPQDYQYADYIISNESGWCPTKAQGEHSCPVVPDNQYTPNGYGLCQATPGSKMSSAGSDWATNPVTQLKWCNGYAVSRYGSWFAAYNHWTAYRNW
jgi:uncharacterized protein YabE (DUF348 family)